MEIYMNENGQWDGRHTDPKTGQKSYTSGPTGSAKFDSRAGVCPDGNVTNAINPNTAWPRTTAGTFATYDWNVINPIWPNKVTVTDGRDAEIVALKAQILQLQEESASLRAWIRDIQVTAQGL
jgi:hypothetical protein